MKRVIAISALIGFVVGLISVFVVPAFTDVEFIFNQTLRQQMTGSTDTYTVRGGSIYAVGSLIPLLFGLGGALIGYIIGKAHHK